MPEEILFNPLDKNNLGKSVGDALLLRTPTQLPPTSSFNGAGIYAIYYTGDFPAYQKIADMNQENRFQLPIYVGKAIPAGGRKGIVDQDTKVGPVLFNRLSEHAKSIRQVGNLKLEHFACRYLLVDDIWIPLGESLLIKKFAPLWNQVIDGFGNHDPGKGRYEGECPSWDTIHPGRSWAAECRPNRKQLKELLDMTSQYLARK